MMPQPGMPYQPQMQPQPGVWAGQPVAGYAPAPMYAPPPPPAPSMFNTPSVLVSKLPLLAIIGLGGFSLVGLLNLIAAILSGTSYHSPIGYYLLQGIGSFVEYVVLGVVWFAVLMTLKFFADKHEAPVE